MAGLADRRGSGRPRAYWMHTCPGATQIPANGLQHSRPASQIAAPHSSRKPEGPGFPAWNPGKKRLKSWMPTLPSPFMSVPVPPSSRVWKSFRKISKSPMPQVPSPLKSQSQELQCLTVCLTSGGVNTVKQKRAGRPMLPHSEKRGHRLSVSLTSDEYTALMKESASRGESGSDLVRGLVTRFLARVIKKTPR